MTETSAIITVLNAFALISTLVLRLRNRRDVAKANAEINARRLEINQYIEQQGQAIAALRKAAEENAAAMNVAKAKSVTDSAWIVRANGSIRVPLETPIACPECHNVIGGFVYSPPVWGGKDTEGDGA